MSLRVSHGKEQAMMDVLLMEMQYTESCSDNVLEQNIPAIARRLGQKALWLEFRGHALIVTNSILLSRIGFSISRPCPVIL
jgi:hypothetical protein